ncbi:DUF5107 domain-containing protein [Caenorhabditis elegans]|uniref:DUF5107 domain-containing protein n=1 Tax=Caenorhabditis elegans TaxID=6239 RepID=Q9XVD9_CAEEL|nr:DUF5107 domain-containing protein [Caenorhabditis elegans]CAB03884.1 DUF5107 domain-containing protein [Caenorhabditis elegans]|eukprot:NP_507550.1 Uncharacterized protein CELE_C14A6.7 [Caenorhabditis elegans]
MPEKIFYDEKDLDPTLREFWLDGLAQQARRDAYTAEASGNHKKARELLKNAEKYEAEAEIIHEEIAQSWKASRNAKEFSNFQLIILALSPALFVILFYFAYKLD